MKEKISITVDSKLLQEVNALTDGIKLRNTSQTIEFLIRRSLSERRTAVILAGGPEEKLKADGTIKPLLPVGNSIVIERIIYNLRNYKFLDIIIVGRKGVLSEILKKIGDGSEFGVNLTYVEERDEKPITPLDTARTLKILKDKIKKSFLCLNCDIVFDYDLDKLWSFHIKNNDSATLSLKATENPSRWSVVLVEGNKIIKYVEKPKKAESYIVYTGIFIGEPEILNYKGTSLEHEIFPQLAAKGLLSGYICSGKCEQIRK